MTPTSARAPLAHNRLLQALFEVQTAFLQGHEAPRLFERVLAELLELTGSEHGFIGEVVPGLEGTPTLRFHALKSLARAPGPHPCASSELPQGSVLSHLQSLANAVLTSGQPVVSPASAPAPRCEAQPEGSLRTFLGLPFHTHEGMVGLVGLANRPWGYDDALREFLQPFLATCGSLLLWVRNEQKRRRAEENLRRAQERLLATERLASLGALSAGVAHEINNPLAYMLGNLNYAIEELRTLAQAGERFTGDQARDILDALDETHSGSTRVRDIVRDLKLFSRTPTEQHGPVDLHALLDSCANMAWGELKHRAQLVKDYGEVPPIHGNESQLARVFLHLLINAAQALPPQPRESSEIRLSTRHEEGRVMIAVRDTGVGIPAEHLDRLFEPFFSTRPASEATGLGLSLCHTFVTELGGHITVESQPGRGSTFRVFLPVDARASPADLPRRQD